jgi:hypothetical protein
MVADFRDTIRAYNISWTTENTTIVPIKDGGNGFDEWTTPGVVGLLGMHMSVTTLAD